LGDHKKFKHLVFFFLIKKDMWYDYYEIAGKREVPILIIRRL